MRHKSIILSVLLLAAGQCLAMEAGPIGAGVGAGAPAVEVVQAPAGADYTGLDMGQLLERVKQDFYKAWNNMYTHSGFTFRWNKSRNPQPSSYDMSSFEKVIMQHKIHKKDFKVTDDVDKVFEHLLQVVFRDESVGYGPADGKASFDAAIQNLKDLHSAFHRAAKTAQTSTHISSDVFQRQSRSAGNPADDEAVGYESRRESKYPRDLEWIGESPYKRMMKRSASGSYSELGEGQGTVLDHTHYFEPQVTGEEGQQRRIESLREQLRGMQRYPGHYTQKEPKDKKAQIKLEEERLSLYQKRKKALENKNSKLSTVFNRADAHFLNPGILGDLVDINTFTSANAGVVGTGAALSAAGRAADAVWGAGAVSNPLTRAQEQVLNRASFGSTEYTGGVGSGIKDHEKIDEVQQAHGGHQAAKIITGFERQLAQPLVGLFEHGNTALNAKSVIAYNKWLKDNKNSPEARAYLKKVTKRKRMVMALMALETGLKSSAHWLHVRRGTNPHSENPEAGETDTVKRANMLAAAGALVGLARRAGGAYTKYDHTSRASDHAEDFSTFAKEVENDDVAEEVGDVEEAK